MSRNYWKNKLEEKEDLEELQKIYKDEVMGYKLSKAAGEQYYSTMFKPITKKLEETIEPLKELKELSEERMGVPLPAPVAPIPIEPTAEEEEDEFMDVLEEGAVGEDEEESRVVIDVDKGLDIEGIKKRGFKPPSEHVGKSDEDLKKAIREIGNSTGGKKGITREINKIEEEIKDLKKDLRNESKSAKTRHLISREVEIKKTKIENLKKEYENLEKLTESLQKLKGHGRFLKGKGLFKIKRNGQYGSSYIDIPLLKIRKILRVVDGYGNPLLKGNISKDFIDLITKRFNSKKKYKGSSIEAFKLLNKLSSMPTNKRSKKIATLSPSCIPTFYDNPRDLLDHLDLILVSIEAGNNNLKNEGNAVIDELLKIGAINREGHERIYKRFLT